MRPIRVVSLKHRHMKHIMHFGQLWREWQTISHRANSFQILIWPYEPRTQLAFLPNRRIFLHGDAFTKTLSPTLYSISLLFRSAYDFCQSLVAFNLCQITCTFSSVSYYVWTNHLMLIQHYLTYQSSTSPTI